MTNEEMVEKIRILLGNPSQETIPDSVILLFITKWSAYLELSKYPEREPLVIYNALVDCLRWLIFNNISSGESSITERMEKIGNETISVKQDSSSGLGAWEDLLEYIEANPDYVDPSLNSVNSIVIIGGVERDIYNDVLFNPNSKGIYSVRGIVKETNLPFNLRRRRR